jgi:selenide,water dikinase
MPKSVKLTLVTDTPTAFFSGMIPGAISNFYTDGDITIHLEPLAKWCHAEYIEKKVIRIVGDSNKIELDDGSSLDYDLLVVNIGSRTRGSHRIPGVWEHSLTTRPISFLMRNIINKENYMLKNKLIPVVGVCGAGAAGIELAFGYKSRWSKLFG